MTDIPTGGVRTLHMEVGIFGFDYDQMIGNEDFMQVFSHEEIGVNVVNTYIRFLYDKLMRPNGLDVSFGFLAPATVNLVLILNRPDTVTEYVLRILMDNKDAEKLFFIPFNTGGHWLLLAINPIREIVYYLDSLGNDWTTYPDMKVLIDTVLQAFRAQRVIQTSRRGRPWVHEARAVTSTLHQKLKFGKNVKLVIVGGKKKFLVSDLSSFSYVKAE
ncbi:uncharacterized protein LOC127081386 [Lathyrus oleraceus]|uniref:uncharacterized protein LOC127081386 n=1 Tax=Pisum sativum TaxID=3888 RepID=UPI0021D1F403|nr:uncharacterized protein LOC127081386 [Pisum sativum]